jgi:thioredoxin reductase (NADPH)
MKLMMDTQEQVRNLGGEIRIGKVEKVEKNEKGDFEIFIENGDKLISKALIVTTGAQAKWLGLPKEQELIGRGISGCATCDGMFFRDKVVAVVGGGDVAATDAEFLTKFASKLYLIHRRDELRAQIPQQKKVLNNPKIEFLWNSEVKEILGKEKLEGVVIKNNKTGEEKVLELGGLFVAIGHTPATTFMEGLVELKDTGQIITGGNKEYMTMTSQPGIFAAGDGVDDVYRQAIVAAGDGAKAGLDAEKWIGNQK